MNTWRYRKHSAISTAAYHDGGSWEQHGVDWGNGTKPILLWHKGGRGDERFVVFKVPAGKHWQSITSPSVSHPGSFLVQRLVEEREDGNTLITEELFEMPITKRKDP
jgi:hypothetical protein